MNRTVRNVGLVTLAAAAFYYPAVLLYRYISSKRKDVEEVTEEAVAPARRFFFKTFSGKHNPDHRRKLASTNGHLAAHN